LLTYNLGRFDKVTMKKCLAFVLGGGGARGALQVGALRALFEAGFKPDLLVGTSIGAVNALGLALWGTDLDGIEVLEQAYQEVADAHVLDPRLARITLRALSGRPNNHASRWVKEFLNSKGVTPDLHFDQVPHARLGLIGADLNTGQPVIYGQDPSQSVFEGIMASIAIPPWFTPLKKEGHYIMDGGALSNLPVEPAMALGATEIIALDLDDPEGMLGVGISQGQHLEKLVSSVTRRHASLELALAAARSVPVQYLMLKSSPPVPIWDFSKHRELSQVGYETASRAIPGWFQTT
jgi:NTE family protein